MRGGLWLLAWNHVLYNRAQTVILTLCLAVTMCIPMTTRMLIGLYESDLRARAQATPLLAGARGNRFDLSLAALYFRHSELEPMPYGEFESISREAAGVCVPISVRFTAQGYPVVGTSADYFSVRGMQPATGELPQLIGDAVVGWDVAQDLGLSAGDSLFSDPVDLYDIAKPSALKMHVTGVLARTGSPDDRAVFTDIKSAWVLEGISHGHQDVVNEPLDPQMVIGKTDELVAVSLALMEYNEVTPENAWTFHTHADPSTLPLTAVLVWPTDAKSGTILKGKVNQKRLYQMVIPSEVISDLMAFVFRIQALFDSLSVILGLSTMMLIVLVMLLSARIRSREFMTLNRIGCSRFTVLKLYAMELGLILFLSVILAVGAATGTAKALPDLVHLVS
ncbi:MAG: ABC transporter permease [Planctomycetes bacterium]|nr:ABC transporter permease [Planctomycetota bacterium]NOG53040.1 ABC transporter permease [Planctomycetota bacterium]